MKLVLNRSLGRALCDRLGIEIEIAKEGNEIEVSDEQSVAKLTESGLATDAAEVKAAKEKKPKPKRATGEAKKPDAAAAQPANVAGNQPTPKPEAS